MAFTTLFRNGEQVTEQVLQALLGKDYFASTATSGVGSGFASGVVGITNGATGADPNHFSVQADGSDLILTIRGGWAFVVKDAGTTSFAPLAYMIESSAPVTYTVPGNASGTTRVDTICLRIDQSISPDATGSNLPTIYNVQGGASSALGNAPTDGALYFPLALVTIDNGETSLTSADVTDKRFTQTTQTNFFAGTGRPTTGTWTAGQFVIDQNGLESVCVVGGTPGSWRSVGTGAYVVLAGVHLGQTVTQNTKVGWNGATIYDPAGMMANSATVNYVFQNPALGFANQIWEIVFQVNIPNPTATGSSDVRLVLVDQPSGAATPIAGTIAGGFAARAADRITLKVTGTYTPAASHQLQPQVWNNDAAGGSITTDGDPVYSYMHIKLLSAYD